MAELNHADRCKCTHMSANLPEKWSEPHFEFLRRHGCRIAAWNGAGDESERIAQDVILKMYVDRDWWTNPDNRDDLGDPYAFMRFMSRCFINKTKDFIRWRNRDEEAGTLDPVPTDDPAQTAIENEERRRKNENLGPARAELSRILAEFVGRLSKKRRVTYEVLLECAQSVGSSLREEERETKRLLYLVGALSGVSPPRDHGVDRTGDLIKSYLNAYPDLECGTARRRISRLRREFKKGYRRRLEDVLRYLRS